MATSAAAKLRRAVLRRATPFRPEALPARFRDRSGASPGAAGPVRAKEGPRAASDGAGPARSGTPRFEANVVTAWRGVPSPVRPTQGPGRFRELDMRCPRDGAPFELRECEGHIGFCCTACSGAWLPRKYVRSIATTRVFSYDAFVRALGGARSGAVLLACPAGCGRLTEVKWYEATLSWCPSCEGLWLDRGELRGLLSRMPRIDGPYEPHDVVDGGYVPYRLRPGIDERYGWRSIVFLTYACIGVLIDDLYLPGRQGGVHLHGVPMWFVVGAMWTWSAALISVIVDRYDPRSNEPRYLRFACWTQWLAALLFVTGIALDVLVYRSSSLFTGR